MITVPNSAENVQLRLVALSAAPAPLPAPTPTPTPTATPNPTPTPTAKSDQSVKAPRAKAKKDTRVRLAARTRQGQRLTWSTTTAKFSGISKDTVRTKRKGTCSVIANAAGTPLLNPLTQRFKIRVK